MSIQKEKVYTLEEAKEFNILQDKMNAIRACTQKDLCYFYNIQSFLTVFDKIGYSITSDVGKELFKLAEVKHSEIKVKQEALGRYV